jgi:subtilase family serine protease
VVTSLVAAATLLALAGGGETAGHASGATSHPLIGGPIQASEATAPEPTSACQVTYGINCYSPGQFENAYNLAPLHAAGIDGSGETIAIIDSFGSPTIANDLHQFDQTFGQANPYGIPPDPAILTDPNLTIIQPAGAVPPYDPNAFNGDMVGWAEETTLDVEWAHVFAPKANILLVETPTDETEGVQGFPEIVTAENYVIDHHLAGVISQSFGATEETFPNTQIPASLETAFQNAQHQGVTVLGASGDTGSTDYELNLSDLFPMQVDSWPSSDSLVTSVGGTQITLDDSGNRTAPDVVWNDGYGAGGGGVSAIFKQPDFQKGLKSVVGKSRGTPDISMNAAVNGGVWVYYTFVNPASPFHIFGGTSAATPQFAGVVAMADQVAGGPLGNINKALYSIPYGGGLTDVTSGNNGIGPFTNSDGKTYDVPGFSAGPGYDLASGLGTVDDAARFVPALANAAGNGGGNTTCTGSMSFASIRGNLDVPKGSTCTLNDTVVSGNVSVEGTFSGGGVTIGGNLQAQHGGPASLGPDSDGAPSIISGNVQIQNETGASNVICDSQISGNVQIQNDASQSVIGTSATCATGNTIGGNLQVQNNTVAGAPAAVITGNTVQHDLQCQNNTQPPTGSGNTVGGKEKGQCAGF